jgi:hypothetical protein
MTEYELTGQDWTRWEVEAVVPVYLQMLVMELEGKAFNKAEHNREIRRVLTARSKGSVEFKHQNISAVLIDIGLPYIEGYKPRFNYQDLLTEVVLENVTQVPRLLELVDRTVEAPPEVPTIDDILKSLVDAPAPPDRKRARAVREQPLRITRQRNFLLQEVLNSALGRAGEEFVMRYETARLSLAGRDTLAARVEQVSRTRGDGEGFDILSFDVSGADRLIEVKTTKFGAYIPFFVTANEFERSKRDAERYHTYRVFGFREKPQLYTVAGAFDEFYSLDPVQYLAKVKPSGT